MCQPVLRAIQRKMPGSLRAAQPDLAVNLTRGQPTYPSQLSNWQSALRRLPTSKMLRPNSAAVCARNCASATGKKPRSASAVAAGGENLARVQQVLRIEDA